MHCNPCKFNLGVYNKIIEHIFSTKGIRSCVCEKTSLTLGIFRASVLLTLQNFPLLTILRCHSISCIGKRLSPCILIQVGDVDFVLCMDTETI